MVFNLLTYQRPYPGVPATKSNSKSDSRSNASNSGDDDSPPCTSQISGIPDALSFDRIISGGTCPVSPRCACATSAHRETHTHSVICDD